MTQVYTMDKVAKQLGVTNKDWRAFNERIKQYGLWLLKEETQNEIVRKIKVSADPDRAMQDAVANIANQILGFADESDIRQKNFANLASLGSPEAWRLFAEANHFDIPDPEKDPAIIVAMALVRQYINLPQLIFEIAAMIETSKGEHTYEQESTT